MADVDLQKDELKLSVVIATLGGPTLRQSIEVLNKGTRVPHEILICIPQSESKDISEQNWPSNVRVAPLPVRGQVAQRALGFQMAVGEQVMQMDDDVLVASDCIEKLQETLEIHGPNLAVSPGLYIQGTGESVYQQPTAPKWIIKIYYWLMNGKEGFKGGFVDKSCGAMGVDPNREKPGVRVKQTEWVPGGCVLQRREYLIVDNFFPFNGKAYCEDIIHSHMRTMQGIKMMVDLQARCEIEVQYGYELPLAFYFKELKKESICRNYYAALTGRSAIRLRLYYLVTTTSQILRRVVKAVNGVKNK